MYDIRIKLLDEKLEESYANYISEEKRAFLYHSLHYRDLLHKLFPKDKADYLVAVDEKDQVVGCLPVYFRDGAYGKVANSLPYYGAHGCVLSDSDEVRTRLLDEYVRLLQRNQCSASTLVGSPDENLDALYKEKLKPDYIDERIELMTYFPYDTGQSYDEALMAKFHYKTRNAIRKAEKNGVRVEINNAKEAIDFLHTVHEENMTAIGGIPKSKLFFDTFPTVFEAGRDYNIYIARMEEKNVAAMLVFYFNNTVEYYTPAILSEYRSYQPLSCLIYVAMQDAMQRNMERWNWGGTGLKQNSLYQFKSRWGTTESRYYYYTCIYDRDILKGSREEIMDIYFNYYVYPFHKVES